MTAELTVTKSLLDKPLHQLTEDDISQLTREDCRRYLKQKGMRRPSWNKSQAIQQVICLKTLLEPPSDSAIRNKICIPRPKIPAILDHVAVGDEASSPRLKFLNGSRTAGVVAHVAKQPTIFCCGKVNVCDDIPSDMLIARALHIPQKNSQGGTTTNQSVPCYLQTPSTEECTDSSLRLLSKLQKAGVASSRKASVQRYLEKRKDRFQSKRKVGTPCASLEMYLNHQGGNWTPTEYSGRSGECSPTQSNHPA